MTNKKWSHFSWSFLHRYTNTYTRMHSHSFTTDRGWHTNAIFTLGKFRSVNELRKNKNIYRILEKRALPLFNFSSLCRVWDEKSVFCFRFCFFFINLLHSIDRSLRMMHCTLALIYSQLKKRFEICMCVSVFLFSIRFDLSSKICNWINP